MSREHNKHRIAASSALPTANISGDARRFTPAASRQAAAHAPSCGSVGGPPEWLRGRLR
jgi:hypothetical protein